MSDTYIVHLTGKKEIVKRCENDDEVIRFIVAVNKNSSYLKNETFESFEYADNDDGVYVIKDGDQIRVMKKETLKLDGYIYSSVYILRKIINQYELIQGDTKNL